MNIIDTSIGNPERAPIQGTNPQQKAEVYRADFGEVVSAPEDRFTRTLSEVEREYILAVLERNNWNRTKSARILGIDVKTLYNKLKSYRVKQAGESE